MNHKILSIFVTLLVAVTTCYGQGPFCGAVGTPGCTAVRFDSSMVVAWATGCVVERGPVDIINPDGPHVFYGADSMGIGPASTVTTIAVSLGDGGTAVLTFDEPICNHPGPDFAVFENSFNDYFLELAFVEVSSDGEHYVRFPATSLTSDSVQVVSIVDPTMINNLAGKYRVGYGTPFDLDELCDSTGIDLEYITHVRLVDVVGTIDPQYATYDAFGHIINDPYPTNEYAQYGSGGFDLTGLAVLRQQSDHDGINDVESCRRLALWPNPTTDRVNISGAEGEEALLFDFMGRIVKAFAINSPAYVLDLDGLSSGIYMLRIGDVCHKVVKR